MRPGMAEHTISKVAQTFFFMAIFDSPGPVG